MLIYGDGNVEMEGVDSTIVDRGHKKVFAYDLRNQFSRSMWGRCTIY